MTRPPILPPPPGEPPRRRRLIGLLRNNFIAGVVVIAPIGLTVWLIWTLVGWIDSWVLPFVPNRFNPEQYIGINLRGVGVIFFILFTFLVGALAKGFVGRSLLRMGESLVAQMPVVRSIYSGLKQIAETVFAQTETSFDQACLIEYPRKGIWALAFISTSAKGEVLRRLPSEGEIVTVFLPTTPNPTSGFLLFLPRAEVTVLDMSVEDAAKLVISAGLVTPPDRMRPKDGVEEVEEASVLRSGTAGR
ncbi:DUF502 domain-containing protein [Limimaricola cinnabarinus]|uniref:DUF502 domain-containing protein n=1 Tax=Limimaricola cinnabarinus TaxID=1125964 RepID=UPI0024938590|nr:DUF502 domain-containing protein [Limimaricola cinnabarinus]